MQFLKMSKIIIIGFILVITSSISFSQTEPREISATSFTFQINGIPLKLNHFSSPAVDQQNEKITNLVIVIHGTNRNPYTYHQNMRAAAEKAGVSERTLVISPGFITESDLNANKDMLGDDHAFWTNTGWKQGDPSLTKSTANKRAAMISSFDIMDSIIWKILSEGNFPNIKQVVVSGNSAGGQYVNRYIGGNLIHDMVKKKFKIEIKYMLAAPSSYTYLTPERPVIGSPGKYFIPADTSCNSGYNNYRHGIENLNEYMSKTGAEKYKTQYGIRKVAYFVGALDNDPDDKNLDKSCPAMLQGLERRNRAELFAAYLFHVYGKRWPLTIVPDSGHDNAKMWASPEGMQWLFN